MVADPLKVPSWLTVQTLSPDFVPLNSMLIVSVLELEFWRTYGSAKASENIVKAQREKEAGVIRRISESYYGAGCTGAS